MTKRDRQWPASIRVLNTTRGTVVAERVQVARSLWERTRGLMLRPTLPPGTGLLIDPCSSIHSMWMRFPIDVLYLNRDDVVVRIAEAMPPWQIGPLFTGARYVIELPPGTIRASKTSVGDRLDYVPARSAGATLPDELESVGSPAATSTRASDVH
ncbi:DUF192 domain-containing protein [Sphaerobacter sp.]|uniref:DUF192 domain-containing protein n=1 Tax=Sphaerobacter sp. TaxID=2099654 RepID=UPI001DC55149|nr:DUF192 domain-containing protein [Sphaerobacter sp.]MBX5445646.1 DUF192 domain-containing protein [Sphaerobacter sp.]